MTVCIRTVSPDARSRVTPSVSVRVSTTFSASAAVWSLASRASPLSSPPVLSSSLTPPPIGIFQVFHDILGLYDRVVPRFSRQFALLPSGILLLSDAPPIGIFQVFHDILGLYDRVVPRFSRQFALLEEPMRSALATYCAAVKGGSFPAKEHTFSMAAAEVTQ